MHQLTENVFQLDKAAGANAYLVVGVSGVDNGDGGAGDGDSAGVGVGVARSVLIDTGLGFGAEAVRAEIESARDLPPVTDIVLTHYDPDHAGAAAALQKTLGARVWIGRADAPILRQATKPPTRSRRMMGLFGKPRPPADLLEIGEESEIIPGLLAIPAPGHTPGHTIYTWRGVVFCGDAARLKDGRLMQFPSFLISDKVEAVESELLIASLRPRLVCPGHGKPGILSS
jgi:hydroxyacylglutathione hydrolase